MNSSELLLATLSAGVGMRREVSVLAPAIAHVRVPLGRGEVGVAKHFLDAPEVGAALE